MKKQKNDNHSNKVNYSPTDQKEPWSGNPDDHESTTKVERDE